MAAQSSRRWYQFNLRALLLLTVLCCIALGIHVGYKAHLEAKRRAEIEAKFRWLESLGYPPIASAQAVQATTRYWRGDPARESHRNQSIGFLIAEKDESFTVLALSLRSDTFQRQNRDAWMNSDATFEPVSLRTIAIQALAEVQGEKAGSLHKNTLVRFGAEFSRRGELFVLAWACWRQGHVGLAKDLLAAAEPDMTWHHKGDPPPALVDRLAADLAYAETWRATRECGTMLPRTELLSKFRWLQRHFPQSEYATQVAEKVVIYQQMVAEDQEHAQDRAAGVPFDQLSQSEQIAELIFQLRDQNGHQMSQPGSCDVLDTLDGRQDSPGHRLVEYGYDAIPQLAAALSDDRLTRSVGFHRDFYFSHHVLTVGDAAEQLLQDITNRRFDTGGSYEDDTARIAAMQKLALDWHAELSAKGEVAVLVEAVERADGNSVSLARRLMKKHPDAACTAILTALRKTDNDYKRISFLHLLGRIPSDESLAVLLGHLHHPHFQTRIAAAEALTDLRRSEGIEEMLRQWQNCRNITEVVGLGPFLAKVGQAETLAAVTSRFAEQSIEERLNTMETAAERHAEELAARRELRAAVVELLLTGLRDTGVRSGMSGSRGDKSFTDPRVCDLAGFHLNELDPAAFPFDLGAPFNQRERERLAILAAAGR